MSTPAAMQQRDSREPRRSMRLVVWEGSTRMMGLSLCIGVFLAGFARALGADARAMGFIGAMPMAGQMLQVVGAQIIKLAGGRRRVFIAANILRTIIWASMMMAALHLSPSPALVWAFVLLYGINAFCASTGQLAWLAWMRDLVPLSIRGRYFARRNRMMLLAGIVLSIPAARFIDKFREARPAAATQAYGYVFGVAALLITASTLIARHIQEPRSEPEAPDGLWRSTLRAAWRSAPFRRYFFFRLYMHFAMATTGPLLVFYLLKELHYSTALIAGLNVLATIAAAFTLLIWGRLADRFGHRPVMVLIYVLKAIWCGLYVFLSPDSYALLLVIYILSASGSGNMMVHHNMLMKLVPPEAPTASLALFNSLTRLGAIFAPVLSGYMIHSFLPQEIQVLGITLTNWQVLILISTFLRAAGILGLIWVHEPRSTPLRHFIRILFRGFTPEEPLCVVSEKDAEDQTEEL